MRDLTTFRKSLLERNSGERMYALIERLYPICRSITGRGIRETLSILSERLPIEIHEVPSGTPIFDWVVPPEWNIREAWIKGPDGQTVVDFAEHNLHLVSYSTAVNQSMSLDDLRPHLHSLPDRPNSIPYRTSYYDENWGFCLKHSVLEKLSEGEYQVFIDSTLEPGSLTYGELLIPGRSNDEILLSAHTCHPSLANDNLSGIALLCELGAALREVDTYYSYRMIFAPGTIGSITWLSRNRENVSRIRHGLVVSCVGDSGGPTYKRSRRGDAVIDRAMQHVLTQSTDQPKIEDFSPYGYDERQYCSPGFNLPVGLFERSKYGDFPEYHTSDDNLAFVSADELAFSGRLVIDTLNILESNCILRNTKPFCEPQLGKRGLYQAMGGDNDRVAKQMAMLWILNLADGDNSLLDIAERACIPYHQVCEVAELLQDHELLVVHES